MKTRSILVFAMLALTLCLACSPAPLGAPLQVSCDDFMKLKTISKEAAVTAGSSFTVALCSNASTGFNWSESAQISDPAVLKQVDHKFVPPQKVLPGTPGQEVWTFKALKKGTSIISLEYNQPWVGGEKGAWKFNLTVVVK